MGDSDRYRVVRPLGRGGMGAVYLAYDAVRAEEAVADAWMLEVAPIARSTRCSAPRIEAGANERLLERAT